MSPARPASLLEWTDVVEARSVWAGAGARVWAAIKLLLLAAALAAAASATVLVAATGLYIALRRAAP